MGVTWVWDLKVGVRAGVSVGVGRVVVCGGGSGIF